MIINTKKLDEIKDDRILKLLQDYDEFANRIEWSHQRKPVERRNAEILSELKELGVKQLNNRIL